MNGPTPKSLPERLGSRRLRPGVRCCHAPDVAEDLHCRPWNQGIASLRNPADFLRRPGSDDYNLVAGVQRSEIQGYR